MSYLHIPNSGDGSQRLGKVTVKSTGKRALTYDTSEASISEFSKPLTGPNGVFSSVSTSINPKAGAYNGVETVGFNSISGLYDGKFTH